jgi:hypothetical protein
VTVGRGDPFKIFDADVRSGSATATNIMTIPGECKVADHGLFIGAICAAKVVAKPLTLKRILDFRGESYRSNVLTSR